MKCSTSVIRSLEGSPLRRVHPCLICVVYTVSMLPSHLPVENPIQVCGVLGRMRAAVHPDHAVLLVGAAVHVDRDQALRLRVAFLPDSQAQRAAMNIGRRVDLALMLGQAQAIGIPAQRPLARCFVDRQPEEIHQLRARPALRAVLVKVGPQTPEGLLERT